MRYRLRTLLIVPALGPLVLAWGWQKFEERRRHQEVLKEIVDKHVPGRRLVRLPTATRWLPAHEPAESN
jgi:hypothetical protein